MGDPDKQGWRQTPDPATRTRAPLSVLDALWLCAAAAAIAIGLAGSTRVLVGELESPWVRSGILAAGLLVGSVLALRMRGEAVAWGLAARPVVRAAVAGAALSLVVQGLADLLVTVLPSLAAAPRAIPSGGLLAVVGPWVVLPAVVEELFFRGALQPGLVARYGALRGVALAAVCFAAFHVTPLGAVSALGVGLLLGAVALRWGLAPAIAMHAGFNLAPLALVAGGRAVGLGLAIGGAVVAAAALFLLLATSDGPPCD